LFFSQSPALYESSPREPPIFFFFRSKGPWNLSSPGSSFGEFGQPVSALPLSPFLHYSRGKRSLFDLKCVFSFWENKRSSLPLLRGGVVVFLFGGGGENPGSSGYCHKKESYGYAKMGYLEIFRKGPNSFRNWSSRVTLSLPSVLSFPSDAQENTLGLVGPPFFPFILATPSFPKTQRKQACL